MENEISKERIDEMIDELNEFIGTSCGLGFYFEKCTKSEKEALINRLKETKNEKLSLAMYGDYYLNNTEKQLTTEEKQKLKDILLKTIDTDIACSVILNMRINFTEDERNVLRKMACKTTNSFYACHLFKDEAFYLDKNKETRLNLRKLIIETQDPDCALMILKDEQNLLSREDYLGSLEFTPYEIKKLKQVIIESKNIKSIFGLLHSNEKKPERDTFYDDYSPYSPFDNEDTLIELTSTERQKLIQTIMESKDSIYAYETFTKIKGLSDGERLVLKGTILQTKDLDFACRILWDTNFFPSLNSEERLYLKNLAVNVKEPYYAEQALIYIYDLTQKEREQLEKVASKK